MVAKVVARNTEPAPVGCPGRVILLKFELFVPGAGLATVPSPLMIFGWLRPAAYVSIKGTFPLIVGRGAAPALMAALREISVGPIKFEAAPQSPTTPTNIVFAAGNRATICVAT